MNSYLPPATLKELTRVDCSEEVRGSRYLDQFIHPKIQISEEAAVNQNLKAFARIGKSNETVADNSSNEKPSQGLNWQVPAPPRNLANTNIETMAEADSNPIIDFYSHSSLRVLYYFGRLPTRD